MRHLASLAASGSRAAKEQLCRLEAVEAVWLGLEELVMTMKRSAEERPDLLRIEEPPLLHGAPAHQPGAMRAWTELLRRQWICCEMKKMQRCS